MRDESQIPEQSGISDAKLATIAARIDRPVVLVGLMGTGKTTVGRKLASLLGKSFADADEEIEKAAQLSVGEIFEQFGEDYFRDGERRVIARMIEEQDGIIATGGGAFVNDETRMLILDRAIAVWIDCDIEILVERTTRRDTRPLLRGGDPLEILSQLHKQRKPFYSQAHIRVGSEDGPHYETAIAIIEAIDKWL